MLEVYLVCLIVICCVGWLVYLYCFGFLFICYFICVRAVWCLGGICFGLVWLLIVLLVILSFVLLRFIYFDVGFVFVTLLGWLGFGWVAYCLFAWFVVVLLWGVVLFLFCLIVFWLLCDFALCCFDIWLGVFRNNIGCLWFGNLMPLFWFGLLIEFVWFDWFGASWWLFWVGFMNIVYCLLMLFCFVVMVFRSGSTLLVLDVNSVAYFCSLYFVIVLNLLFICLRYCVLLGA